MGITYPAKVAARKSRREIELKRIREAMANSKRKHDKLTNP